MSWVRLDDGAPGHRKIVGLSDAAFRLWIVGLTYCGFSDGENFFLKKPKKNLAKNPLRN